MSNDFYDEDYGADYQQQQECEQRQWEEELWNDDYRQRSIDGGF